MPSLLLGLLFTCAASASRPGLGPAASQLSSAYSAAQEGGLEESHGSGAGWSDGAGIFGPLSTAPSSSGRRWALPPSPLEVGERYDGFEKGFAIAFTAVEWAPNLIAAAVPGVGTPIGGVIGLVLLPVGIVAGLAGGLVAWAAGLL